ARFALTEVGARLSDVFGAEDILWVEGHTEELCFPLILSRIAKQGLLGTAIIGIVQIGDLEGKHSKTIFEIYERLSKGRGLLPPALGFIFDQEGRSERECKDLIRQSGGKVFFLPRRTCTHQLDYRECTGRSYGIGRTTQESNWLTSDYGLDVVLLIRPE
ncbi:MAG: hypothetical protein ACREOO_09820, partial [bacterium]